MPMAPLGYRFGGFRLAPAARELWLDEALVALPPKSLDCLIYLVEHRERAVGRDELISAVWGRTAVSDDVLAQTLLRARRAVGDTGNDQRAIRTVPRFGYRWILPVEEIAPRPPADETGHAAVAPRSVIATPRPRLPGIGILAFGIGAVIVAAAALWALRSRTLAPSTADDHAVLVLPVAVSGGDQQSSWIRLGAMDYIASSLRAQTPLKVLPSEQTLLLAGAGTDPADAGTLHRLELATGTRYVLAPHATFSGAAWSFVLDAYHHDGVQSYEARAENPLDAANLALARFVTALGVHVPPPAATTAATELVQRMDAAVLAGDLAEAHRLADTTPDALKNDPAVRVRTGSIAFRAGQLDEAERLFEPLAADASLAPDLRAKVLMGLGAVAVRRIDFETAERNYSAAIATLGGSRDDPNLLGSAYGGRGVANGARGKIDAALADFGRARVELERAGNRIDAASVDVNLALVMFRAGRLDEADGAFDRAIDRFSRFDVRDDLAAALVGKTNLQLTRLEPAGALATTDRLAGLAAALENPILRRHVFSVRAHALLANGQLAAVARLLDDLDPDAASSPEIGVLRAKLALERGDAAGASAGIAAVLDRGGDLSILSIGRPEVVSIATVALRRGGDAGALERALADLRANGIKPADDDPPRVAELADAALAIARGNGDPASHFAAARAIADRHGVPDAVVEAVEAELLWRIARRELEPAKALAGRLSQYTDRDYDAARSVAAFYRAAGDTGRAEAADAAARKLAGERDPSLPL
jgi:DNA-binding winged helix-turn-helix (wHTH) protein/tetratricopeptide (TPR) repeat protein